MLVMARSRSGIALQARLRELGYTQTTFARELNRSQTWVSQSLLDDTERTLKRLWVGQPESFEKLLETLDWDRDELISETGVYLPDPDAIARPSPRTEMANVIPGGLVLVEVMGAARGGRPSEYAIPVRKDLVRPSSRAFEVSGDSMDTGTDDGIRDGDWVLIDTSETRPVNGKVYLLEILGDGMTVKRLRKAGEDWLFLSDNPNGEVWRSDQVDILGQVYGKIKYGEVR